MTCIALSNNHFFSPAWSHIDYEAFKLSTTMTLQSLVKHLLTEGDKIIITWFSPLQDQGGYALAANYGDSLILLAALFTERLTTFLTKARSSLGSYFSQLKRLYDCSSLEYSVAKKRSKNRLRKLSIPFILFFQYR